MTNLEEQALHNLYDHTLRTILNTLEEDRTRIIKLEQEIEALKQSQIQFGGYVLNHLYPNEPQR